ncbi:MAG TPA: NADH-quinone oxidoreductase subunit M, partial [Actinomycetales bacterium]|nr:NADH-quinone oxidoreductase subunit M [Actinomycetales bacterium]
ANAGTSTLLVGVLDKVGTFGMLTLCLPLFPNATKWAAPVIIVLAVISILYGALLALGQNDIMRLIAYTSVSHFGFIVLGIFVFTDVAQTGATFYMLNHGFATAGLFLIAGMLIARGKTQQMDEYGGMQKVVPLMAGTFLVAGMATLSLPGTSSFVSEFLVLVGTFSVNKVAGVLATTAIVLAALYVLFMYQRVFTGPVKPELAESKDLSGFEKWAVGPIVAALLIFGLYPKPVLDILQPASEESVAQLEVDTASNADPSALSTTDEGSGK